MLAPGKWYAITAYSSDEDAVVTKAGGRHDITEDVQLAVIAPILELVHATDPRLATRIAERYGLTMKATPPRG